DDLERTAVERITRRVIEEAKGVVAASEDIILEQATRQRGEAVECFHLVEVECFVDEAEDFYGMDVIVCPGSAPAVKVSFPNDERVRGRAQIIGLADVGDAVLALPTIHADHDVLAVART